MQKLDNRPVAQRSDTHWCCKSEGRAIKPCARGTLKGPQDRSCSAKGMARNVRQGNWQNSLSILYCFCPSGQNFQPQGCTKLSRLQRYFSGLKAPVGARTFDFLNKPKNKVKQAAQKTICRGESKFRRAWIWSNMARVMGSFLCATSVSKFTVGPRATPTIEIPTQIVLGIEIIPRLTCSFLRPTKLTYAAVLLRDAFPFT